ncbi:MAG: DUF2851 family protein [Bacteroidales bacterium]|nr:DUF2851 family protein [Bacteroidales bacterium]
MTESFLQFIWKNRLFVAENLTLTTGESIEILDIGEQNKNAGPDFFNVKIKVDNTIWAGCAELHIRASDWLRHNHLQDKAYNNVILHIVEETDKNIQLENGQDVFTLKLQYDKKYLDAYLQLYRNQLWVPCQKEIGAIPSFVIRQWLSRLLVERLEKKSETILALLETNNNSWEETFYQVIARSFDLNVNAQPFEMLAKSIPLKILARHKDNLMQLEALLYGQAGFLSDENVKDDYYLDLRKEYSFLKKKYQLTAIESHIWKFLRLRPVNFPTIRISQFACLIFQSSALFSKLLECKTYEEYLRLLNVSASEYWNTHYTFGKISGLKDKKLGSSTIDIILMNTIVPFLFIYGKRRNIDKYVEKSIQLLENMKPEDNSIIRNWVEAGVMVESAFYSQALIQLKNEYCKFRRCLECQVGNSLIMR